MKILHAIPSPRDNILEVLKWQHKLPFDLFIPKFLIESDAYHLVREFFLEHEEYTHLAIGTDDIVVKPEHLRQLEQDIVEYDYPVICGMMNVNQEDLGILNITPPSNVPHSEWSKRKYEWISRDRLYSHTQDGKNPIIEVGFNGFALMIIRRDIVQTIDFYSDYICNPIPWQIAGAFDVQFCFQCHKRDIPIYTDTRVDLLHLRKSGTHRVGIDDPYVIYRNGKDTKFNVKWKIISKKYTSDYDVNGLLSCLRCGAEKYGKDLEDAKFHIDHGIGLAKGVPCGAYDKDLQWNGHTIKTKDAEMIKVPYLS